MRIFLNVASIMLIILIGCKDNATNSTSDDSFYPMKIGNTWNYDYKSYDSLGKVEYEKVITETFNNTRTKNGSTLYEFDSPLNPAGPAAFNYTYYYQKGNDGIHWLISTDRVGYWVADYLLYKYPCVERDYYPTENYAWDTTFVTSLHDTVICAAGTFSCIVYKYVIREDSISRKILAYTNTYVAKGIGKVKYELYSTKSEQEFKKSVEYTLNSYKLY